MAEFTAFDMAAVVSAMTMSCNDAGTSGVQRFEDFTGAGKRRDCPPEVKVSIVAECYSGQESVSAVDRRHDPLAAFRLAP